MRAAGDSELKVYGIFGYPLAHTVSPAIHNRAFDYHKLKSLYFAFERPPARFHFLMRNLKKLILDGFNVTIPFKEVIIPYLDRLDPIASAIGAVNTVKKEGTKWIGCNTDAAGFLAGLRETNFSPRAKTAVILGAGGGARAVIYALAAKKAGKIVVANRTQAKARALVRRFQKMFSKIEWISTDIHETNLKAALKEADILVNTTSVGLKPNDSSLVSKAMFPDRKILVCDLIYRPRRTRLLLTARKLGNRILNGEAMLLHQGAKAFEVWTHRKAPVEIMRKALRDALGT